MNNNSQNPSNPSNPQPQRPQYYGQTPQMNSPNYNPQSNPIPVRQVGPPPNLAAGPTAGIKIGAQIGPRNMTRQRGATVSNTYSTPGIAPNTLAGFQTQSPNTGQYQGQARPPQGQFPNQFNQNRIPVQQNPNQINRPQINPSQIGPVQINLSQSIPSVVNPVQINQNQINPSQSIPSVANQPQINQQQIDPPQINQQQMNPPQINPPQINPPQINPPQINPPQINQQQINSPQINPPQINPPQINQQQINSHQINQQQMNPPQINPPQINPPQINPPQINPPQINQQQINSPQINQQPPQGFSNRNALSQSQRPFSSQNMPGVQQRIPPNGQQLPGNNQQSELRSSLDPPLYRSNSNSGLNLSMQPGQQSPPQQQVFTRQPPQQQQVPQFANLQQQMQYEMRMKQEEERRKLIQLRQEEQLRIQQKRAQLQKQQEENENNLTQDNDNSLLEKQLSNPQFPSQQPLHIEPLAPPIQQQQEPTQIESLSPPTQQLLNPLTPSQQPLQIEPLVPPTQQQPLQIEPLVPPTQQQPLQIEPLAPPTQQQPLQIEPLVPPTQQQPLQIEPPVPSMQQQPLQIESLSPPTQSQSPPQQFNRPVSPTLRQNMPGHPQNIPGRPQSVSSRPQNTPGHPQNMPGVPQNIPGVSQNIPGVSQNIPGVSQNIPGVSQNIPGVSQNIPGVSQNIPGVSQNIPGVSQNIPGISQNIPGISQNIPGISQNIPGVSQNIPGASQNIPGISQNIPLSTQNLSNVHAPESEVSSSSNSFKFTPMPESPGPAEGSSVGTGTVDFNEDLSDDENEIIPINTLRAHRSQTYAPNMNNPLMEMQNSNNKITFDNSKFPRFLGRRETIILSQGLKKRRKSSFKACLTPQFNEQDKVTINNQVQNLLDDPLSGIGVYTWSRHYVVNCSHEENPYIDPKAISLSMQKVGGSNNVVKLFSEKVRPIHFQKLDEKRPLPPSETPNIPMLSDVPDKSKPPLIPQVNSKEIPNAADCYFKKNPPPELLFTIEDMPIAGLSKQKFACLRTRDIKTDFELIEPLFFGAFIVQDGSIISEQWTFTSKGCSQFLPEISFSPKASLQLPASTENAYFCVVVSRFLLPENGATVNKYYQKPSSKTLQLAKAQAVYFNKFIGVYAPFALTFVDLKTVIDNKYFDMPPPIAISQPLKVILKQIKPGQKLFENTYPIYLIFDSNVVETSNIQDVLTDNSLYIRLSGPLPCLPCFSFRHRLLVRVNQVNLHTQARNIFAELKVKSEAGELPIFSTPYSTSKSKTAFTRCWYHEKKPYFDELFIIDLPLPLPKTLSLVITFFNAALKNVGQKMGDLRELIGMCTIPLLEDGNRIIADGEHQYPVDYKGQPPINTPAFNISTLLDSSLISTDNYLNQFYNSVDSQVLEKCSEREITINMFSIIDQIVHEITTKGMECIKSLAILTKKKVTLDWKIIENCLNDYAIYFAFRNENSCTPEFHRSLLSSWAEFMRTNPDSNRTDSRLIPFFFNMIIKSLYLTKDQDFSSSFSAFVTQWSKMLDSQQIGEYARFLNLLFDIGCYYYSVMAIECQMANLLNMTSKHNILIEFLTQVLRPKLFYSAIAYVDHFKLNIIDMIRYSKRSDCTTLQFIYRTFLRLFAQFSPEMKQKIAERLINSLEVLSPFDAVHFIENDGNHPVIYFYCFILSCVSYEAFSNWFTHQVDHFKDFFKTLHFIIAKMQDKELRRVAYFAVLHILSFIAQMKDLEGIIEATNIIYHFLCVDLPLDFVCPLIRALSQLIEENYSVLIVYSNPALPRHLVKVLELSYIAPEEVSKLFKVLYQTDLQNFGNFLRSQAICYRAVYSLKSLDYIKLAPEFNLPISPVIHELHRLRQLTKSQLSEEKYTEIIQRKALIILSSPDSTIEALNELVEYHRSHEYFAEEIQTLLLQASIILEFLVAQKKIDISYLKLPQPCKFFTDLCPICEHFRCPEGGDFVAKSYCDSPMFSERSLINHLIHIIQRSQETKYLEFSYLIIDRIWPILEHRRIYTLLTNTFTRISDCYKNLSDIPTDEDRLFGHYFRICFYGSVFREENGKIYIYREKKLTHLFELTNRLVGYYTEVCKPTQIELIKESGGVDVSKLDPSKGYIQITFVEPYFQKNENYTRITTFERSHVLQTFFFDTPFTKGGNKAQASIDQQWVRRTLLSVELPMPSIIKRISVNLSREIEFAPIRVAYRQIRDRINLLKNAIERSDYRAIQQLLHGSLLVQVNEGPSRMAEVFLGEAASEENSSDMNYNKYKEKMKAAFKEFLIVNQKGIDVHGKYVDDHPVFVPLQHELESGFSALQEKISNYISE